MTCPVYNNIRPSIFSCIKSEIGNESYYSITLLNDHVEMLLLLGLDYPIDTEDLYNAQIHQLCAY